MGGGEDEEGESDGREAATAIAREALLKFGPMKFTQMTLEHEQRYMYGSYTWEKYKVEMPGIEPGASHMQSEHSTTELHVCRKIVTFDIVFV